MTIPTELAAFPSLAESVLGPLLVGFAASPDDALVIDEVWRTAADSVPTTMPVLKVRTGKAVEARKHRRHVLTGQGTDYPKLARLCDIRGTEPAGESWKRGRWTVAAKITADDRARQLLGAGRTAIRIDVTSYRLLSGKVLDAAQLALFRHYVATGFLALDPGAVVLGGQHDWQDAWWQLAQETP